MDDLPNSDRWELPRMLLKALLLGAFAMLMLWWIALCVYAVTVFLHGGMEAVKLWILQISSLNELGSSPPSWGTIVLSFGIWGVLTVWLWFASRESIRGCVRAIRRSLGDR